MADCPPAAIQYTTGCNSILHISGCPHSGDKIQGLFQTYSSDVLPGGVKEYFVSGIT